MKNIGQLMKQAQEMQTKMKEMQERLADIEITGSSGAGMVTVIMNGQSEVCSVKIDPKLLNGEETEIVEDLIVAAFTDAKGKVETRAADEMSKLTGGLDLPSGFNLPF